MVMNQPSAPTPQPKSEAEPTRETQLLVLPANAPQDPLKVLSDLFDRAHQTPSQPVVRLQLSRSSPLIPGLTSLGVAVDVTASETHAELLVLRDAYWQLSPVFMPWLRVPQTAHWPLTYSATLPIRPPKPAPGTVIYERWIPHLQRTFSLRVVNANDTRDTRLFSDWQNSDRVAEAWMQTGSLKEHTEYLRSMQAASHVVPVFGLFAGVPAMYAELYYVQEDHLAPHVPDLNPFDRGIHVLVGSEAHRGARFLSAWAPSLAHALFLWDPRTQRLYMEPRLSNDKIIRVMARAAGFAHVRTFDFPHKRAALLELTRERFFALAPFGPEGVGAPAPTEGNRGE